MRTNEQIDERVEREAAVIDAVKQFREVLLGAGFRHANGAGELVSKDNTTWVSTCYTRGEYSIYGWRRERGYGEIGEQRQVLRVTAVTDLAEVDALARRLKLWANRPRKNAVWPPKGLGATR